MQSADVLGGISEIVLNNIELCTLKKKITIMLYMLNIVRTFQNISKALLIMLNNHVDFTCMEIDVKLKMS